MAEAINPDAIEMPIVVPMIAGAAPAHAVYDAAAARIKTYLDAGLNVAVLCEGDALFYGSFMYVLARLKDGYQVEMVAGGVVFDGGGFGGTATSGEPCGCAFGGASPP